jgi:uncharacterized phage protein gp47/JayE
VIREQATRCPGVVTLSKSEPVGYDINIPRNSILTTRKDANGNVLEFIITESKQLLAGQTSVDVTVEAIVPGIISVSIDQLSVISTPIIGIDSVTNSAYIEGGTNIQDDEDLRETARTALDKLGGSTATSIESALKNIDGVINANVIDMARGVGTSDVSVITTIVPTPQITMDEIIEVIAEYKASGIHVLPVYSTLKSVDISVTVTGDVDITGNAIKSYINQLNSGETLLIRQMERAVLSKYNGDTDDIVTITPTSNVTCNPTEAIRIGVLTINDVVWVGGGI